MGSDVGWDGNFLYWDLVGLGGIGGGTCLSLRVWEFWWYTPAAGARIGWQALREKELRGGVWWFFALRGGLGSDVRDLTDGRCCGWSSTQPRS